MKSRVLKKSK